MASLAPPDPSSARIARLSQLFDSYVKGTRAARTANDAKLFLEAICMREDRAECVERLVGSNNALDALKVSLRFDVSTSFLNGPLEVLLQYLRDPLLQQLCNGTLLKQLLTIVVQPPTLWNALVSAHRSKELLETGELAFAWLLLELVSWTTNAPIEVDDTAREVTEKQLLLSSDSLEVRAFGYRIQHVLQAKAANADVSASGPGGRHDNDFADYRKIAIFPTEDELACSEKPFLRRADNLAAEVLEARVGIHLDNQFRLLREDFLAELREDVEMSPSKKKGRRRPRMRLRGLALASAHCGKSRARNPFATVVSFNRGAEAFSSLSPSDRKAYLKDNPRFLKHLSFGCILDGGRIVTFATLFRVEELLLEDLPKVTLHVPGTQAVKKLLISLKLSEILEFVPMDTSVFAYEPVLRCLQGKVELPLHRELLVSGREELEACNFISPISPVRLADDIERLNGNNLEDVLDLPKQVSLDEAQTNSLLAGLRQSVSLVQGPPGTGKPFIGALLAKALHDHTSETILRLSCPF